jgi:hypothetical protein
MCLSHEAAITSKVDAWLVMSTPRNVGSHAAGPELLEGLYIEVAHALVGLLKATGSSLDGRDISQ